MRLFTDADFQFGLETVLGGAYRQASDVGEVLATAERIPDGDAEAWIGEWTATADGAWGAGETARHAGRRASALSFYRRAATYYATALYCTAKAKDFGPKAELDVWRRHRECWEHVVDLSPVPGERISIPYEGTDLRGYFFRAPDAASGARRPLVIMNNGSDGATSAMWGHGGAAAAERGYHWMTFDGPGQQYALYEQGIPFRHDWEAALTPVVDTMLERGDVDRKRMHKAEQESPARTATLEFRGRPYGITDGSRYELFKAVAAYRLGEEVKNITTPMLVLDPEDEQFFPGQPQELYDRLRGEKKLVRFTSAEGGNRHCEPLAVGLRDVRVFDWLESYLG